jgi:hypothetical protein
MKDRNAHRVLMSLIGAGSEPRRNGKSALPFWSAAFPVIAVNLPIFPGRMIPMG